MLFMVWKPKLVMFLMKMWLWDNERLTLLWLSLWCHLLNDLLGLFQEEFRFRYLCQSLKGQSLEVGCSFGLPEPYQGLIQAVKFALLRLALSLYLLIAYLMHLYSSFRSSFASISMLSYWTQLHRLSQGNSVRSNLEDFWIPSLLHQHFILSCSR